MEIETGSVVLALAGRDKGGIFTVTAPADGPFVLIADGKRRKIEKPKRKKRKHLQAIGRLSKPEAEAWTNRKLRKALKAFAADATAGSGGGIQFVQR